MLTNNFESVERFDNSDQLQIDYYARPQKRNSTNELETYILAQLNNVCQIRRTAEKLIEWGLSPLPVAPKNETLRDSKNELLFNGKNPSYVDEAGNYHQIKVSNYYHCQPSQEEFDRWFSNPVNGLGCTIPVGSRLIFIDIDSKQFSNTGECFKSFSKLIDLHPELQETYIETTRSNGYHILVRLPENTTKSYKFTLEQGSKDHSGELLGATNFVVLAPTDGYNILNNGEPLEIQSLEALGIYPTFKPELPKLQEIESFEINQFLDSKVADLDTSKIELKSLLSFDVQKYLTGNIPESKKTSNSIDNFGAFQTIRNEVYGWENWLKKNNKPILGNADQLIDQALDKLIERDRHSEVLNKCKKDRSSCVPGVYSYQGNEGCIRQIQRVLGLQAERLTPKEFAHSKEHLRRSKRKKFSPDIKFEAQYLNQAIDLIALKNYCQHYDVIAVKSAMGTGKTEILVPFRASVSEGAILLGSRNSLLLQTVARLDQPGSIVYHLQNDESHSLTADQYSWLALCVDSLHHFEPHHFDDRFLIIDEATSVYVHTLLSPTVGKYRGGRANHLHLFSQAVQRAKNIILLDGNLNDDVVRWIADKRSEGTRSSNVIKLENTYKPDSVNIRVVTAFDGDKEKPFDQSPLIDHMKTVLNALKGVSEGRKAISVVSDSQVNLEALDRQLSELGYKVLRIDSKTIQEKEIKAILADINDEIIRNQFDVVLLSPTAESGIDISVKRYFAAQFGLFLGLLSTDSQMQFLRRVRDCSEWFIHCVPYTNLQGYKKLDDLVSIVEMSVRLAFDYDDQRKILDHALGKIQYVKGTQDYEHAREILDTLIHERRNSKQCLIEALHNAGHNVKEIAVDIAQLTRELHKEVRDQVKLERADQTFNAPVIDIDQARELARSIEKSTEEQFAIDRAFILDKLQGIENSELWKVDFVKWYQEDRGDSVRQLERFHSLLWLEETKLLSQRSLAHNFSDDETDSIYHQQRVELGLKPVKDLVSFIPWDVRSDYGMIATVQSLGMLQLLDGRQFTKESPEIVSICDQIRSSKEVQKALGLASIGRENIQLIQSIFDNFGISSKVTNSKKKDENGKSTRQQERRYTFISPLDESGKDSERNKTLYECIDRKFKSRLVDNENQPIKAPIDDDFDHDAMTVEGIPHPRNFLADEVYSDFLDVWKSASLLGIKKRIELRREITTMIKKIFFDQIQIANNEHLDISDDSF